VHTMAFPHRLLSGVPVLGNWLSIRSPVGGDGYTPNVAPANLGTTWFESREHASYRQVVDLGAPENALFVAGTGQGGNPFSSEYRAHHAAWREGRYIPMQMDVPPERVQTVQTLVPAGAR
jgi:penicillin amidase